MSWSFFFSYSNADNEGSNGRLKWFYERLFANLRVANGRVDESFFAPRGIEAGENWKDALRAGLNSSSVLVCMQSPSYFESRVCGQELEVFLQRRKLFRRRGGDPPDCIIPVLWHPLVNTAPRSVPNDFQGKKPTDNLIAYPADGLYAAILCDATPQKDRIDAYALNLAGRISNLLQRNRGDRALPSLNVVPDLEVLPSAFDSPEWPLPDLILEAGTGPASVTFVYPTGIPPEALPFAPPPPNAVICGAEIAKAREWIFQGVGFHSSSDFATKLEQIKWAQDKRSPIVLMLTEALLADSDLLKQFSRIRPKGIATIVLTAGSSGPLPDDFPRNLAQNAAFTNRDRFDEILLMKVGKLRFALTLEPTSDNIGAIPAF